MPDDKDRRSPAAATAAKESAAIDRPRLTPQGRTDPSGQGQDKTSTTDAPAERGQPDKAEG